MTYILNTEIPDTEPLNTALTRVFGIGKNKSSKICSHLGIDQNTPLKFLTLEMRNKMIIYIENNVIIGDDLKQNLQQAREHQIRLKTYKGLRRKFKLPLRGQRTHTNAKTIKKRIY